ncbi:winged helix DNA-binding domain-containing protein [Streptomyces sp. t39]|uniref:winged helix DNA-binding domain-containing protein n=1 Tax=Streptomyces sp. t39 TaxID=1828156 RepID=UPI0011CEA1B4|nr:winged helix DNA-binding domain-containing protein [Streptomyces sp. t39]TXS44368.1 winged helix DNA-binding domain-containing protein [Streptomyces sp. t39]
MAISARGLNRSTLARQLLLEREPLDVVDAVRRVVALQAQQHASPYLALWNRIDGFDPAALDAALAERRLVKATLMRVTLHMVDAEDFGVFREAMEPTLRSSRLGDARFRASGIGPEQAAGAVAGLLEYAGSSRADAEARAWTAERLGVPLETSAWRMLRQYAPLWHAPTGGPWSFGPRHTWAGPGTPPRLTDPEAADAGLRALLLRYLAGFGPASVADMARFTTVARGRVKAAVRALGPAVEELEGPEGTVLLDVPGAPRPDEDTPAPPRLMAMWDSVLLAHADRGRVIPPAYRSEVIRVNGDVLPTLLVDGRVAGVWRAVDGGIEATAFHALPERVWERLAAEAVSLTALLADRDPLVYRRWDHWWARGFPAAATRLLPA